jgi:hypothetical protein
MTTDKEVEVLFCKWFHKMSDCNVCLISGKDIEEATKNEYCAGNWQECELYQKEKRGEPLLKVWRGV